MGEKQRSNAKLEGFFVSSLVEGSQKDKWEDIVGQVSKLHEFNHPWGSETLRPPARINAKQHAVQPDQRGITIPTAQLGNETERAIDRENGYHWEEGRDQGRNDFQRRRDRNRSLQKQKKKIDSKKPPPAG